jgi:hypothetical protein
MGCTLTVEAARRGLVGAGGVLRLYPCGLRSALAACATPSWLALCARGLCYMLAAWALPSRLGFALAAHATCLRLGLRRQRRWRQRQWKQRWQMLALAACATRLQAWALPSRLGFACFALAARLCLLCPRGSALPKHNNQTAKQWLQKLLRQRCRLSAAAIAAGGSSAGSCGGIGCVSVGGSVSISGNGGGGGNGSSGGRWQQRCKWRRQ